MAKKNKAPLSEEQAIWKSSGASKILASAGFDRGDRKSIFADLKEDIKLIKEMLGNDNASLLSSSINEQKETFNSFLDMVKANSYPKQQNSTTNFMRETKKHLELYGNNNIYLGDIPDLKPVPKSSLEQKSTPTSKFKNKPENWLKEPKLAKLPKPHVKNTNPIVPEVSKIPELTELMKPSGYMQIYTPSKQSSNIINKSHNTTSSPASDAKTPSSNELSKEERDAWKAKQEKMMDEFGRQVKEERDNIVAFRKYNRQYNPDRYGLSDSGVNSKGKKAAVEDWFTDGAKNQLELDAINEEKLLGHRALDLRLRKGHNDRAAALTEAFSSGSTVYTRESGGKTTLIDDYKTKFGLQHLSDDFRSVDPSHASNNFRKAYREMSEELDKTGSTKTLGRDFVQKYGLDVPETNRSGVLGRVADKILGKKKDYDINALEKAYTEKYNEQLRGLIDTGGISDKTIGRLTRNGVMGDSMYQRNLKRGQMLAERRGNVGAAEASKAEAAAKKGKLGWKGKAAVGAGVLALGAIILNQFNGGHQSNSQLYNPNPQPQYYS